MPSTLPSAGQASALKTTASAGAALLVLLGALALVPVRPAAAIGSDSEEVHACPKGEVWDKKAKTCVKAQAKAVPDDDFADYAYHLAKSGRYEEALATLDLLADPNTAKALNYRGYATRKLGRVEEGIGYYLQSVDLDPRYAQVREYLGEAYVISGRIALARDQLRTIETICGTGCEEYEDLAEAIAEAPAL